MDGDALRALLDGERARFADHGIDASMTLVSLDGTAGPALVAALGERARDAVVAGGGLRKPRTLPPSSGPGATTVTLARPGRKPGQVAGGQVAARRPVPRCGAAS